MNPDEIGNLVRQTLTMILSSSAIADYVSGNQGIAIATGAGALASVLWSIWAHWGMKKVPETSVVVAPKVESK